MQNTPTPPPTRLSDDGSSEEESGKHYYVSSEIHFQDTETHSRLKGGVGGGKFLQEVKHIYLIFHFSRS